MKKVIATFEKDDTEVIGILYGSVDMHVLEVECFSTIEQKMYTTQDYRYFDVQWFFEDDAAYELWYSEYGQKRDEHHLPSFFEYLEVNEVTVKIYSDLSNTRIPNTLPLEQYVPKEKAFQTYR
jgi:hypothetical protein